MSDTTKDLFLYGGLAVGAYFLVKGLTDPIKKPIEDISNLASGVIQGTESLFKNPEATGYNLTTGIGNSVQKAVQPSKFAIGIAKGVIDTSNKLFGTKSVDKIIIAENAKNAKPIMTNIGITASGAMFSSAKPLVANVSTKDGAASQTTIGAKAGTIFSSGASVKSTGASGKYKTGF